MIEEWDLNVRFISIGACLMLLALLATGEARRDIRISLIGLVICVIAYLLKPELFQGRHINVEIETTSDLTLGMTVADWWGVSDRKPNATFMGDVDADGFFALLTERIGRL